MSEYRVSLRIEGRDKSVVVMAGDQSYPALEICKSSDGRIIIDGSAALPPDFFAAAELVLVYVEAFELALRELA
jgi:hypothetical protein